MSVILDALKKLEREKASRRNGPVDIVPEITTPPHRREKSGKLKTGVFITGAVVITALATTFVVTSFKSGDRERKNVPAVVAEDHMVRNAPFVPPVQEPPAVSGPTNVSPVAFPEAGRPDAEPVRPVQREVQKTLEQPKPLPAPAENSEGTVRNDVSAPASLVVSGIAWQDEKEFRRAVVNGSLIGEGAEVGGARIVHIYRNKVRFSVGGNTFDVSVSGQSQGKQ